MAPVLRVRVAALLAVLAGAAGADPLAEVPAQLRSEPFELTADALEYEMDRELYVGRGNVTIRQGQRTLRADWAAFNKRTGTGVASGNVVLIDGPDVVRAEFVQFEIDAVEGVIYHGRFESERSPFRARAEQIAKTGERTYTFRDGEFTTCRCPDPDDEDPWVLRAEEADIEVEGYATARNASFDVLGVPVVWVPWLIFPVMTERQTGFLFPELSLGSFRGFQVGLPFFWAVRDDVGLVLTPRFSTKRGLGAAAFGDYAIGERSGGETSAAYYRDWDIDPDTPDEPFGRDRWSTDGRHDLDLPAELRLQTDFVFASDNEVPFDFKDIAEHRSDRFLRSQASVGRAFGPRDQLGLRAGATFADDLQSPDDLDRDRFLLQRWPTAHADLLPAALPGLPFVVPSLEVDYAWFQAIDSARDVLPSAALGPGGVFLDTGIDALPNGAVGVPGRGEPGPGPDPHGDDFATTGGSEGDGIFQEGEPLVDRGHRLLLRPRLALPLEWRGIQLVPEVGWHQTLYDSQRRDFRERGFLTTRVDLSTRLRRAYGGLVHVLEPRAGYALATAPSQSDNTIFVPGTAAPQDRVRALDLDAVTADDADRIERANRASAGFGNRLYRRGADGSGALLADFDLLGLYEFADGRLDALVLDGRAFPHERVDLRFHADFDPYETRFDEGLAQGRWAHPVGVQVEAGYRWAREIPLFFEDFANGDRFDSVRDADHIHQLRAGTVLDLTARWSVRYQIAYSIEGDHVLANQGLVEYLSRCKCWALGLSLSQDRTRGVEVSLEYRLLGFGGEPVERPRGLLDGLGGLW